jgi:hypothetical protein
MVLESRGKPPSVPFSTTEYAPAPDTGFPFANPHSKPAGYRISRNVPEIFTLFNPSTDMGFSRVGLPGRHNANSTKLYLFTRWSIHWAQLWIMIEKAQSKS